MPTLPQPPGASRRNAVVGGAAAVAAVALAAGLLVWLLPHGGSGTGDDSKSTATATHSASVPASASPSASPSSTATLGALPAAFVGRWKGDTLTIHGAPSTMDLTLKAGPVGTVVGRDHSVLDFLGSAYDCSGNWKLARATATEIVLDTSGNTNPHPGICSDGSNNERITLRSDGTVHYKSGDTLAGQPEGDLTKSGG
jgi:eukaryotic-like serine/threonine-protein kinase